MRLGVIKQHKPNQTNLFIRTEFVLFSVHNLGKNVSDLSLSDEEESDSKKKGKKDGKGTKRRRIKKMSSSDEEGREKLVRCIMFSS